MRRKQEPAEKDPTKRGDRPPEREPQEGGVIPSERDAEERGDVPTGQDATNEGDDSSEQDPQEGDLPLKRDRQKKDVTCQLGETQQKELMNHQSWIYKNEVTCTRARFFR